MRIAIHGVGSLIGQGIIKALRMSPSKYYIFGMDAKPKAVGHYWVDQVYHIHDILDPEVTEELYLGQIMLLLKGWDVEVLLLATDFDIPIYARHKARIEKETGCKVVVSSTNVARIANDKWETYQFLKKNGFPYPPSTTNLEDVASVGYPLVVKPRVGSRSRGVKVIQNGSELLPTGEGLMYQKEIGTPEQEYTAGAVVFDDECLGVIVMRRELKDGNTVRAEVEPHPDLEAFIREVALKLNPYGPCNFQFRLDDEGQPVIFEINARFSGTTIMRTMAGFNEVEAVVRYVTNGEKMQLSVTKCGMIQRYFEEQWTGCVKSVS